MKNKNFKFVVGGILIVAVIIWIFGSISSDNLTYYYTPTEVNANYDSIKDDTIRIMGFVKQGSMSWIPKETKIDFNMTDEENSLIKVQFIGAKPDMLKEGQGVVVEGKMEAPGKFKASNLLVKHSEEYKVDDHKTKKEDYYQSLQN